jgi:hypothetical protein
VHILCWRVWHLIRAILGLVFFAGESKIEIMSFVYCQYGCDWSWRRCQLGRGSLGGWLDGVGFYRSCDLGQGLWLSETSISRLIYSWWQQNHIRRRWLNGLWTFRPDKTGSLLHRSRMQCSFGCFTAAHSIIQQKLTVVGKCTNTRMVVIPYIYKPMILSADRLVYGCLTRLFERSEMILRVPLWVGHTVPR